jgi:hypothetical protein
VGEGEARPGGTEGQGEQLGRSGALGKLGHLLTALSEHAKSVLAILALLATALYGLAFSRFYSALDTSPEAVGISATDMLARSAVGGVVYLLLGTVVVLALYAPFIPLVSGALAQDGEEAKGTIADVAGVGIASAVILFLFLLAAGVEFAVALVIAVGFPLFALVLSVQIARNPLALGSRKLRLRGSDFLIAAIAAAGIGLLAFTQRTIETADDLGEEARAGEQIDSPSFLGLPILGISADPALIALKGAAREDFALPDCVLYLGQSDGTAVVYDPDQLQTLELPASDTILTVEHVRTSCGAPQNLAVPTIRREGKHLQCLPGKWRRPPSVELEYAWAEDGYGTERTRIENRFLIGPGNLDHEIRCAVAARNVLGTDVAYSEPFVPQGPPTGTR